VNHEAATWWAMMISRDIATCEQLLRGEAVSPERLDRDWLELASEFRLVRLDFSAVDLLHRRAELRALLGETTP
jgi:hypothetical protein